MAQMRAFLTKVTVESRILTFNMISASQLALLLELEFEVKILEAGVNGPLRQLEVVELEFTDVHQFMTLNGTTQLMRLSQFLGSPTPQEEKLLDAHLSSHMS